ncbi:DNA polymerase-3 subunit gamma/tau [Actinomyces ruminicola]|uniref:DNA-directed DNA polymerase n=1 Tax=Actinomyces ruminicola TaxID=332524 RepID=A0A1H0ATI6_9ACTO|nr:DNA polymerase III subunit gamma and tau [Actinomyces ruminicola]SDN36694.1 DNA polymerase-3 subunit gamma/tau [Actinomyces ruminicola]
MTTALYRRYRPDTFQDVIGQEHVTAPLMAALSADRVTHAYLFSGPRGCGKTTSARILARCLNCEQFPTDTPCGVCPSCRDLATGGPGSLDVVEIDAASHNGVDDARDLRERASFAPARDRYKVFILDEAHMVTPQGFNALLKLVEEPPEHVKFIFATTEPDKVIGTIRSRTHHYPFRLVPPDILEDYLGHLCRAEGIGVGPGVFPLVVRAGGGSVRDTLSVMDQLIGGAVAGEVDYRRAVALLGYTDTTLLDSCVDAVAAADGAGVFRVVDRVVTSGHDPRRFVEDLLQRLRDLLVIALAGSEAGPALGSLPADELARMEVQARTIGAAGLSRAADVTAQALDQMVGATSPRLQLELLMARLLLPAGASAATPTPQPAAPATAPTAASGRPDAARGSASVPQRSASSQAPAGAAQRRPAPEPGAAPQRPPAPTPWESDPDTSSASQAATAGRHPRGASTTPPGRPDPAVPGGAPSHPSGPIDAGQAGPAAPAGAADAEMIRARWEEVLDAAKRSRRATWALVGPNSQPGGITDGVFQVIFTGQGLVNAFENGGHGPVLAQAIHQALGLNLEVHAVLAGPGGGPGGAAGPRGGSGGPGGGRPGTPGAADDFGARPGSAANPRGADAAMHAPAGNRGGDPGPGSGNGGVRASGGAQHGVGAAGGSASVPAAPAPVGDDGWGEVAVPGARHAAREQAAAAASAPSPAPDDSARPDSSVAPTSPEQYPSAGSATDAGPESPHARPPSTLAEADPAASGGAFPAGSVSPAAAGPVPVEADEPAPDADGASSADSASEPETGFGPAAHTAAPVDAAAYPPATEAVPGTTSGPDPAPEPASAPGGDIDPEGAPLATVHRLRPLPEMPKPSSASPPAVESPGAVESAHTPGAAGGMSAGSPDPVPSDAPEGARPHRLAPVAWDGPEQTFSDGVPLPEEPGDPDGPADDGPRPGFGRLAAAQAAARAAARGGRHHHDGDAPAAPARPALEDDLPSEDDEDAEEAGVVGLEVVKRILGATVLEEVTVTQEGH